MVSGSKKIKKKQEFALAKDKKQAVIALVVIIVFVVNLIRMFVIINAQNNPTPVAASTASGSGVPGTVPGGPGATPVDSSVPTPNLANSNPSATPVAPTTAATDTSNVPVTVANDANNIYSQARSLQNNNNNQINVGSSSMNRGDVEIMSKHKLSGKMVEIMVANSGRANPFLPTGEGVYKPVNMGGNKKVVTLPFLTAPPKLLPEDPEAGKVMSTTISGILYDKYSPSAIINIEGTDYLVKKGDVINHYKILYIGKENVIVKLGQNVYKAGVGQLLTLTDLKSVTANVNRKFGGNDVTIKVRAKK